MKLELKHLAPYLPYQLKIVYRVLGLKSGNPKTDSPDDYMVDRVMEMTGNRLDNCLLPEWSSWYDQHSIFKPMLRPLSRLTEEITVNGERFVPVDQLNDTLSVELLKGIYTDGTKTCWNDKTQSSNLRYFEYSIIEKLFEWHFNVFNLPPDLFVEIKEGETL